MFDGHSDVDPDQLARHASGWLNVGDRRQRHNGRQPLLPRRRTALSGAATRTPRSSWPKNLAQRSAASRRYIPRSAFTSSQTCAERRIIGYPKLSDRNLAPEVGLEPKIGGCCTLLVVAACVVFMPLPIRDKPCRYNINRAFTGKDRKEIVCKSVRAIRGCANLCGASF